MLYLELEIEIWQNLSISSTHKQGLLFIVRNMSHSVNPLWCYRCPQITRRKVAINRDKVEKLKKIDSHMLISVECWSQLNGNLSWMLISVECWSQLNVNLSRMLISHWMCFKSQSIVNCEKVRKRDVWGFWSLTNWLTD